VQGLQQSLSTLISIASLRLVGYTTPVLNIRAQSAHLTHLSGSDVVRHGGTECQAQRHGVEHSARIFKTRHSRKKPGENQGKRVAADYNLYVGKARVPRAVADKIGDSAIKEDEKLGPQTHISANSQSLNGSYNWS